MAQPRRAVLPTVEQDAIQHGSTYEVPEADTHAQWASEAFTSLVGSSGQLSIARLRRRSFSVWLRNFVNAMVLQGRSPPCKAMRTSHLAALLIAKARVNKDGCLSEGEFCAATRVLSSPSPSESLDAEVVWALFDVSRLGEVEATYFSDVVAVWEMAGRTCSDDDARRVKDDSKENGDKFTAEQYVAWLTCLKVGRRPIGVKTETVHSESDTTEGSPAAPQFCRSRCKQEGASVAAIDHGRMRFAPQKCVRDQALRSFEANQMSLHEPFRDRPFDLSETIRELAPTHKKVRALPGARGRTQSSKHEVEEPKEPCKRTPRLPPLEHKLEWQEEEAIRNQLEARLRPLMRVRATYVKPDGSSAEAVGTLLSGWGLPNTRCEIPHSSPPEAAKPRPGRLPELAHAPADLFNDSNGLLVVLINGVERTLPRSSVTAV